MSEQPLSVGEVDEVRLEPLGRPPARVGRLPLLAPLRPVGSAPAADVYSPVRATQLLGRLQRTDTAAVAPGPVLLVDDIARTRWTLTVASAVLLDAGATTVLPLVGRHRHNRWRHAHPPALTGRAARSGGKPATPGGAQPAGQAAGAGR